MKRNTALNISRIFIVFLLVIIASKPIFAQKWVDMGVKSDNGQPLYWADGDLIKEDGNFRIGEYSEIGTAFYWGDPNGGTNAAIGSNIPNIVGNKKYDVVSANTEYPNRMPSRTEFIRLLKNCKINIETFYIEGKRLPVNPNDYSWIYGMWCEPVDITGSINSIAAAINGAVKYAISLYRDNTYRYIEDISDFSGTSTRNWVGTYKLDKENNVIVLYKNGREWAFIRFSLSMRTMTRNGKSLNKSGGVYEYEATTYIYCAKLTSNINGNVLYFALDRKKGERTKEVSKDQLSYWTGSADKNNSSNAYGCIISDNLYSLSRALYCKVRPVRDYAYRDVRNYNPNFGFIMFEYSNNEFDGTEIYVDGKKIPEKLKDGLEIVVGSGSKEILIKTPSKWYSDQTKKVTVAYRENTTVKVDLPPKFSNVKITAGSIYDSISVDNEFVGKGKWEGRLMYGSHNVESRNIYYHPHSMKIDVQKKGAVTFQVPALKRKTLDIDIDSKPQGANVTFDGKNLGTTPLKLNNIPAGSTKTLEISKKNMTPYKCQLTFDEVKIKNVQDVELPSCYVGESELSNKGNLDIGVKLHRMHMNIFDYKPISRKRFFYADLLACGDYIGENKSLSFGGGINIGIYFRRLPFNLETGFRVTNTDSWMTLRFGYGFVIKGDMRITPQFGLENLTSKRDYLTIGAKLEYGIYNFISVGITPSWYIISNSSQIDAFISFFFPTRITRSEYKMAKDYSSAGYESKKETKIVKQRRNNNDSVVKSQNKKSNTVVNNNKLNGHEYVDLGLPSGTKWATCNVGASKPEGYGNYYAYGETTPKDSYTWKTYIYCKGSKNSLIKYCYDANYGNNKFTDNLTTLQISDDAATANWGDGWRMPTDKEMQELIDNCNTTWTTRNGITGMLFTSKTNGKSIFLPAAGYRNDKELKYTGTVGNYGTSSLRLDRTDWCRILHISSSKASINADRNRCFEQTIRPVCN